MAAFAPALTPMLATPPARMFAATNMLVCVLLLLHFCSEPLFPLCCNEIPVRECYTIVTLAIVNGMGNVFCRRVIPRVSIVWTHGLGESAMC
jgi:hypothetical protein